MAIPSLAGFLAGEAVTAAKLTAHTKTAIEESVYYKPFCYIQNTATQSVATGGVGATAVMNSTVEDTDGMADLANNRIKIVTPGLYRINAQSSWANNATGYRSATLVVNGTNKASTFVPANAAAITRVPVMITLRCAANDLILVNIAQSSGANLLTDNLAGGCFVQAEWISL